MCNESKADKSFDLTGANCQAISWALTSELGSNQRDKYCTLEGHIPCWKRRFHESPVTQKEGSPRLVLKNSLKTRSGSESPLTGY